MTAQEVIMNVDNSLPRDRQVFSDEPDLPPLRAPVSKKLRLFYMVFRTRLCKYFIWIYAQKRPFLLRRKSVCLCVYEGSHKSATRCKDLDYGSRKKQ